MNDVVMDFCKKSAPMLDERLDIDNIILTFLIRK